MKQDDLLLHPEAPREGDLRPARWMTLAKRSIRTAQRIGHQFYLYLYFFTSLLLTSFKIIGMFELGFQIVG